MWEKIYSKRKGQKKKRPWKKVVDRAGNQWDLRDNGKDLKTAREVTVF